MAIHSENSMRTNSPYPASTRSSALLPASERKAWRRLPESLPTSTPQGPAADHHSAMQSPTLPLLRNETNTPELHGHDLREVNPVRGPPTTPAARAVVVSLDIMSALRRKALMSRGQGSGWEGLSRGHVESFGGVERHALGVGPLEL